MSTTDLLVFAVAVVIFMLLIDALLSWDYYNDEDQR